MAITTLEEDFKAMGIRPFGESQKKPKKESKKPGKGGKKEDLPVATGDGDNDSDDAQANYVAGQSEKAPQSEALRKLKMHRSTASMRAKWRKANKGRKAELRRWRNKGTTKRHEKLLARKEKSMGIAGKPRKPHLRFQMASAQARQDSISESIQRCARILKTNRLASTVESTTGFAQLALIAESIGTNYGQAAQDLREKSLFSASCFFHELSEQLTALVRELQSGEEISEAELLSAYQDAYGDIQEAAIDYQDLLEACKKQAKEGRKKPVKPSGEDPNAGDEDFPNHDDASSPPDDEDDDEDDDDGDDEANESLETDSDYGDDDDDEEDDDDEGED